MPGARRGGKGMTTENIKLLLDGSIQLGFRNGASAILEIVDEDVWLRNFQPNGEENNHWLSPIEILGLIRQALED